MSLIVAHNLGGETMKSGGFSDSMKSSLSSSSTRIRVGSSISRKRNLQTERSQRLLGGLYPSGRGSEVSAIIGSYVPHTRRAGPRRPGPKATQSYEDLSL